MCCTDEDICKLYCIAEDYDFFFAMSSKVKDGTPCYDHKGDVCVDGVCEVRWLNGLVFGRIQIASLPLQLLLIAPTVGAFDAVAVSESVG